MTTTIRSGLAALVLSIALTGAASAQTAPRRPAAPARPQPAAAIRPFFLATGQAFSASTTFDAGFGSAFQPFWGGGVEVTLRNGVYFDVAVSRFRKTGDRAFYFNTQTFNLGIPMTVTVTPVEFSGGYRFHLRTRPWLVPYAGAGVGTYGYKEVSDFSDTGEDLNERHAGYLVVGGAEFRVHRWVGLGVDAQYTHVPGILGTGGISAQVGESDLGGFAARFRVIVGK
jgi:opacity protein-like surface antigen